MAVMGASNVVRGGLMLAALLAVAGAWSATACGTSPMVTPRAIRLGQDTCVACQHVVHSLDAAAQVVLADGTTRIYDDLGCLATDAAALRGGGQFYVQFSGGRGWVPVTDVHFAHQTDRRSPRGYNYFAYTEDEARNLDVDHWARGWDDVVATLRRR